MSCQTIIDTLDRLFVESCKSVINNNESDISETTPLDIDFTEYAVASIDGGTDDFELVITLNMPFSSLAMTYPSQSVAQVSEEELEDWIAELTNRLLGKLNQGLSQWGHYLKVGLPQQDVGVEYLHVLPGNQHTLVHGFEIDGEYFQASIQMELFRDDIPFSQQENRDFDVDEGEIEFF